MIREARHGCIVIRPHAQRQQRGMRGRLRWRPGSKTCRSWASPEGRPRTGRSTYGNELIGASPGPALAWDDSFPCLSDTHPSQVRETNPPARYSAGLVLEPGPVWPQVSKRNTLSVNTSDVDGPRFVPNESDFNLACVLTAWPVLPAPALGHFSRGRLGAGPVVSTDFDRTARDNFLPPEGDSYCIFSARAHVSSSHVSRAHPFARERRAGWVRRYNSSGSGAPVFSEGFCHVSLARKDLER
jgi:hypothetical protein